MFIWFVNELLVLVGLCCNFILLLLYLYSHVCLVFSCLRRSAICMYFVCVCLCCHLASDHESIYYNTETFYAPKYLCPVSYAVSIMLCCFDKFLLNSVSALLRNRYDFNSDFDKLTICFCQKIHTGTVEEGRRSINRDESSYTLSHTHDGFLATSQHYRGKNRKKN